MQNEFPSSGILPLVLLLGGCSLIAAAQTPPAAPAKPSISKAPFGSTKDGQAVE
jgi:hypothetical protein